MDILRIILSSAGSLAVLFIITKILGNKQVSQMSMLDYVIGISIGSISAEMATDLESPLFSLTAMIFYGAAAFIMSLAAEKYIKMRLVISGKPVVLMDNGIIFRENLKKEHIDINDFLMQCRSQGYFDLSQIQTVVMEYNGSLSILPVSTERPASPADMGLNPKQGFYTPALIVDGRINENNLRQSGKNKTWIKNQLKEQGYSSEREILLGVCSDNKLTVYPMETNRESPKYE